MSYGIITLTGPSCSGKTTLLKNLIKKEPELFQLLRSYTSRAPRPGEQNGVEYDFISEEEAARYLVDNETVQRVHFNGHEYGTHFSQIDELKRSGKIGVTVVEPTGVEQFSNFCEAYSIPYASFYIDNHPEVLIERWLDRIRVEIQSDNHDWRMATFDKTRSRIMKTLGEELNWYEAVKYSVKIPRYTEACQHSVEGLVLDYAFKMYREQQAKTA